MFNFNPSSGRGFRAGHAPDYVTAPRLCIWSPCDHSPYGTSPGGFACRVYCLMAPVYPGSCRATRRPRPDISVYVSSHLLRDVNYGPLSGVRPWRGSEQRVTSVPFLWPLAWSVSCLPALLRVVGPGRSDVASAGAPLTLLPCKTLFSFGTVRQRILVLTKKSNKIPPLMMMIDVVLLSSLVNALLSLRKWVNVQSVPVPV